MIWISSLEMIMFGEILCFHQLTCCFQSSFFWVEWGQSLSKGLIFMQSLILWFIFLCNWYFSVKSLIWLCFVKTLLQGRPIYIDQEWFMTTVKCTLLSECSHIWTSWTTLVLTALSGRVQTAWPAAQVCLGFQTAEWLNRTLEEVTELCVFDCSCMLFMSAYLHWLSMKRKQVDRDGSLCGPSVMDDSAENTFSVLTAPSVVIHTFRVRQLHLSAKRSRL